MVPQLFNGEFHENDVVLLHWTLVDWQSIVVEQAEIAAVWWRWLSSWLLVKAMEMELDDCDSECGLVVGLMSSIGAVGSMNPPCRPAVWCGCPFVLFVSIVHFLRLFVFVSMPHSGLCYEFHFCVHSFCFCLFVSVLKNTEISDCIFVTEFWLFTHCVYRLEFALYSLQMIGIMTNYIEERDIIVGYIQPHPQRRNRCSWDCSLDVTFSRKFLFISR